MSLVKVMMSLVLGQQLHILVEFLILTSFLPYQQGCLRDESILYRFGRNFG